jgi:oxygen-independent coproporphyrinogen III oxidase
VDGPQAGVRRATRQVLHITRCIVGITVPERTTPAPSETTEVGSYFVATYPPFSTWSETAVVRDALPALDRPPVDHVPLGVYLHIPFCRKRCHFCYFRVYTDKNAHEVNDYLDVLAGEWERLAQLPAVAGRPLSFVYFGGGTPSFLSSSQLKTLMSRVGALASLRDVEELTFECEPGTLTEAKLTAIREMGVTRLSLGVENFDDDILTLNGRAHRSPEICRAFGFARSLGFPQINIDLIAGMLGETDANWRRCIERTLELSADSVTIYQMELPYNTTISRNLLGGAQQMPRPADWPTKRRWVGEAFEALESAGYHVQSAYTAVKDASRTHFVYRDRLWQGADMIGLGVASFGHVNGVHTQNHSTWETYAEAVRRGEIPLSRAYRPTDEERLIRELVLQLKLGAIQPPYFRAKYGVDVLERFRDAWTSLASDDCLKEVTPENVALTRRGLLQVDSLLPRFFLPRHRGLRYT